MESQQDGQGWSPWGRTRGKELGLFSLEMAMGHLLLASATSWEGTEKTEAGSPQSCAALRQGTNSICLI